MSQYIDYQEWPAKAEPSSPYAIEEEWYISDNLGSDGIVYQSVPLSLIQDDKSLENVILKDETFQTILDSDLLPELDDESGQLVPTIKFEDVSSPPYSPIQPSGNDSPNDKASRALLASKLLEDLDSEERFPEWSEEKTDLTIFEDFSPVNDPASQTVLEFHTLCNGPAEKTQFEVITQQLYHLTPPQSPPQLLPQPDPFSTIWQHVPAPVESPVNVIDELVLDAVQNITWQEPNNNVQLEEMQSFTYVDLPTNVDEEIVPMESEIPRDVYFVPYSASVSGDSSASSCSPNSPSSSSCSNYGSSENDDDWVLTPSKPSKTRSNRRSKPYSTDDKKSRKKEQNKNAATRYRQKKKAEIEVLMGEERELQIVNDKLTLEYNDIRKQVACLKKFMRDVLATKRKLLKEEK